jgi:hypothetical protein
MSEGPRPPPLFRLPGTRRTQPAAPSASPWYNESTLTHDPCLPLPTYLAELVRSTSQLSVSPPAVTAAKPVATTAPKPAARTASSSPLASSPSRSRPSKAGAWVTPTHRHARAPFCTGLMQGRRGGALAGDEDGPCAHLHFCACNSADLQLTSLSLSLYGGQGPTRTRMGTRRLRRCKSLRR